MANTSPVSMENAARAMFSEYHDRYHFLCRGLQRTLPGRVTCRWDVEECVLFKKYFIIFSSVASLFFAETAVAEEVNDMQIEGNNSSNMKCGESFVQNIHKMGRSETSEYISLIEEEESSIPKGTETSAVLEEFLDNAGSTEIASEATLKDGSKAAWIGIPNGNGYRVAEYRKSSQGQWLSALRDLSISEGSSDIEEKVFSIPGKNTVVDDITRNLNFKAVGDPAQDAPCPAGYTRTCATYDHGCVQSNAPGWLLTICGFTKGKARIMCLISWGGLALAKCCTRSYCQLRD